MVIRAPRARRRNFADPKRFGFRFVIGVNDEMRDRKLYLSIQSIDDLLEISC